jgi:hypothetical protein
MRAHGGPHQLLLEIRDQVVRLQTLGNFDYQSYAARFAFDSVKRLMEERQRLELETTRYVGGLKQCVSV